MILRLFDLPHRVRDQPVALSVDPARLQRATECPRQSARRGRHDVVERGRAWLEGLGRNLIMRGHRPVDAEDDRLRLAGEMGTSDGTLHALDPDL
jgi:hypothetical protein